MSPSPAVAAASVRLGSGGAFVEVVGEGWLFNQVFHWKTHQVEAHSASPRWDAAIYILTEKLRQGVYSQHRSSAKWLTEAEELRRSIYKPR